MVRSPSSRGPSTVLCCTVQYCTVLYSVYCSPSRLVCLFLQTSIILYSTVLSVRICNMVQGAGCRETCNVKYCTTRRYRGLWPLTCSSCGGLRGPFVPKRNTQMLEVWRSQSEDHATARGVGKNGRIC